VLSGRGLCDELIIRPEESYRLWCVVVCDLETLRIGAPYIYDFSNLRVNPVYALTFYFFKIHFSLYSHLRQVLPNALPSFKSSNLKTLLSLLSVTHATCTTHFIISQVLHPSPFCCSHYYQSHSLNFTPPTGHSYDAL